MKRLMFWWFLAITSAGGVQQIGPFTTQVQCRSIAKIVQSFIAPTAPEGGGVVTDCWRD